MSFITSAGRSRCRRSSTSAAVAACCWSRIARSRCSARRQRRPLGSFGDWSVFCLYKTLPLPNGALLVQNRRRLEALERLPLRHAGSASVLGRTAELLVQRIRGRANRVGAALQVVKRGMGRAAGALDVRRANVGDIGFNLDEVDLAMSGVSARLLERLDFEDIRRRRIANYRLLDAALDATVQRVFSELPDGVCPLFFPIVVRDKAAAARALQQRGVDALEFWNESMQSGDEMGPDCALPADPRPRAADSPGPDATAPRARGARRCPRCHTGWSRDDSSDSGRSFAARDASPLDSRGNDRHRLGTDDAPSAVERPSPRERGRRSVPHLGMAARLVDDSWPGRRRSRWWRCVTAVN